MAENHEKELVARLYKMMLLIRRVEERIAEVYHTDVIKSPVHLSIGQESIAAGACDALEAGDFVSNTYRCHATYIAKGGDLNEMMAELYGKKGGCAGGKAGSMHLVDMKNGIMGASAVVGTTIPVAAGYSWALKQNARKTKKQQIVLSLFGDGGTEEGCFPETLNFAAIKKLPIIFLCENNRLAIHSLVQNRWASQDLQKRVESYGIKTASVDDGDVFKVRDAVLKAAEHVRSGKGPYFLECATYRWKEHVGPGDDMHEDYRDKKEFEKWQANDQIARLAKMLDENERNKIHEEIETLIKKAEEFAEKSPFPGEKELFANAFAA